MKRKLSAAKAVSPEDLMKSCGALANELGLTEERRIFFQEDDPASEPGWLSGWTGKLNEELEIEIDAVLHDGDESGSYANGRIGNPFLAVWSVTVWPTPDDDEEEETSAVLQIHHLPFSEALRLASAIIQTHRFKKE